MAIAGGHALPIPHAGYKCSPNESTLVEDTLSQRHVGGLPKRLIADRAYDSDRLDERQRQEHSVELIVPNRRRRKLTQDGRSLRRYRRRWNVERLFCLPEELPPYLRPLELSLNGSTRMHVDSLETSTRLSLVLFCVSCARQPRRYQQREAAK
jgi:hypothetical protein